MTIKLANNVSGFLNTAITASDTGIVLQSGNGASFPSLGAGEYFYATLVSTGNTLEVVKVTARSGDSMTVVRAQDGTSAASFAAGSRLEMRINAQAVLDVVDQVTASQVGFTPVGGIAATDVQAALAEVDSEKIAFTRLDDSDGSSLVGFLQAGTNAVQRTVQGKLRDVVSVFDFMTSAQIADVQAGTFLVDVTAALQDAINACFGSSASPNGGNNPGRLKNRALYIPNGGYRISDTLQIRALRGGHIFGAGRFATTIKQYTADKPIIRTNGCDYTVFEHFHLDNSSVSNSAAIFEFDWDSTGGVALQSCTFRNLYFSGRSDLSVLHGLRIGLSGYMGSENIIDNCFFSSCQTGLQTRNFNALQNIVLGGNFQGCFYGIRVQSGSISNIIGVGFQNDLSTTAQIDSGGYDIAFANSANDTCVIEGCRTESMQFVAAVNQYNPQIINCTAIPSRVTEWSANNARSLNNIVNGGGAAYRCTTAGTTGGSAPSWGGATVNDGTVVWTRLNYFMIDARAGYIQNCILPYGRVRSDREEIVLERNYFTRQDFVSEMDYQPGNGGPVLINNFVRAPVYQGGTIVSQEQYSMTADTSWQPAFVSLDAALGAIMFRAYGSGPVGFTRGRRAADFIRQNSIAIEGALSPRVLSGTDVAGLPLYISGGTSTGSAAGGNIIFQVSPGGSAGTTVNVWETAATVGVDKTVSAVNGFVMRTATAANIASAAAAVNGTGKKAGLVVFDTTNNRLMVASGATTVSPWYVVDGSASVTPT